MNKKEYIWKSKQILCALISIICENEMMKVMKVILNLFLIRCVFKSFSLQLVFASYLRHPWRGARKRVSIVPPCVYVCMCVVYPISALIVSSSISRLKNAFLSERTPGVARARVSAATLLLRFPWSGRVGNGREEERSRFLTRFPSSVWWMR